MQRQAQREVGRRGRRAGRPTWCSRELCELLVWPYACFCRKARPHTSRATQLRTPVRANLLAEGGRRDFRGYVQSFESVTIPSLIQQHALGKARSRACEGARVCTCQAFMPMPSVCYAAIMPHQIGARTDRETVRLEGTQIDTYSSRGSL